MKEEEEEDSCCCKAGGGELEMRSVIIVLRYNSLNALNCYTKGCFVVEYHYCLSSKN